MADSFAQSHPHRQPLVAMPPCDALQGRNQRVRHGFPWRPLEVFERQHGQTWLWWWWCGRVTGMCVIKNGPMPAHLSLRLD